jgi:hypothetical protein
MEELETQLKWVTSVLRESLEEDVLLFASGASFELFLALVFVQRESHELIDKRMAVLAAFAEFCRAVEVIQGL